MEEKEEEMEQYHENSQQYSHCEHDSCGHYSNEEDILNFNEPQTFTSDLHDLKPVAVIEESSS